MNLLVDGLQNNSVIPTDISRKLTIGGITKTYPVYKIRLDMLFYNDQNDRIASWLSQYRAEHEGADPVAGQREEYNTIIENFVIQSNPTAIAKTKDNIREVDQRETGSCPL